MVRARKLYDPRSLVVDPELRVHRTDLQPEGAGCRLGLGRDIALTISRQPRGCHVEGLLEEGTVQRIGLVKQSKHLEPAVVEQSFEGHLAPRNKLLDENGTAGPRAGGRVPDNFSDPIPRAHEGMRIVGPNDTATGRKRQWFEHTGVSDSARQVLEVFIDADQPVPRTSKTGLLEDLA